MLLKSMTYFIVLEKKGLFAQDVAIKKELLWLSSAKKIIKQ